MADKEENSLIMRFNSFEMIEKLRELGLKAGFDDKDISIKLQSESVNQISAKYPYINELKPCQKCSEFLDKLKKYSLKYESLKGELCFSNASDKQRKSFYQEIEKLLKEAIPKAFHDLFAHIGSELRHLTLISAISSTKGIEHWWKYEILGQLQRNGVLPLCSKDLIVCAEQRLLKQKGIGPTDLVLGTPKGDPDGDDWYNVNLDLSTSKKETIVIPIELKYSSVLSCVKNVFNNPDHSILTEDIIKIQEIIGKYNHFYIFGVVSLLVVGLNTGGKTKKEKAQKKIEELKRESADKNSGMVKIEFKDISYRLVLDEEIKLQRTFPGEDDDDPWTENAWAHQFVWIIEKSSTPAKQSNVPIKDSEETMESVEN